MQIKPLSNKVYLGKDVTENVNENVEKKETKFQDKLELSEEARNIQKSQVPVSKFDKIKDRLNKKFYDSNEVISQTADKILKDIKKD